MVHVKSVLQSRSFDADKPAVALYGIIQGSMRYAGHPLGRLLNTPAAVHLNRKDVRFRIKARAAVLKPELNMCLLHRLALPYSDLRFSAT